MTWRDEGKMRQESEDVCGRVRWKTCEGMGREHRRRYHSGGEMKGSSEEANDSWLHGVTRSNDGWQPGLGDPGDCPLTFTLCFRVSWLILH